MPLSAELANDEQALEAAGEVFRLGVAERVILVGRALGDRHHQHGEQRRGEVDEGLHRVRQQADRAGDPPCAGLHRDSGQRGHHRELEQGLGLHGRRDQASVTRANLRLPTCTT
jgi:hypothetical protein